MTEEGFKRKLTTILSADAVGYSRLMEDDEEATVRTLTSYREVLTTLIQQHNGMVVDSPGDNLLAEFISVVSCLCRGLSKNRAPVSMTQASEYRLRRLATRSSAEFKSQFQGFNI
jgi:adenylate cyclase